MHLTDSCAQLEWMEYLTVGILDGYRTVKDNYMYVRVGHTRYREIVVAVLHAVSCLATGGIDGVVVSIDGRR